MTTFIKNATNTLVTINDLGHSIGPNEIVNAADCCNEIEMAKSDDLISKIASGILVVNDGSSDDTARTARQAGAIVISHKKNKGKSSCIKTRQSSKIGNRQKKP